VCKVYAFAAAAVRAGADADGKLGEALLCALPWWAPMLRRYWVSVKIIVLG